MENEILERKFRHQQLNSTMAELEENINNFRNIKND